MKNKTRIILTAIFALLYAALFAFIIYQSSSSGEDSTLQSGNIVAFLVRFDFLKKLDDQGLLGELVRKLIGHFSEFGLLGIFGYFTFRFALNKPFDQLINLSAGLLLCSISEITQIFALNRGPEFIDVVIDFQGYLSAFMILTAIMMLISIKRKEDALYIKNIFFALPFLAFAIIPFFFFKELSLAKTVCYFVFLSISTLSSLTILISHIIITRKKPL